MRLWPGVIFAALLVTVRFLAPVDGGSAMVGALAGGALILLWWLLFSRAPWAERLGVIGLMIVALLATSRVVHASISNGFMGMMFPLITIPFLGLALVVGAVASRRSSTGTRRAAIAAAIVLACGAVTLVRTFGVDGGGASDFHWRWTMTPEERLLAQGNDGRVDAVATAPAAASPAAPASTPVAPGAAAPAAVPAPTDPANAPAVSTSDATTAPAVDPVAARTNREWPGFRGPERDGAVRGVRIEADWSRTPPVQLWRRPVGPAWSSFAVHGDLLYTQEQRGEEEIVSCYRLSTGEPVWKHRDTVRFWESNAGAGPRGTPTLSNGRAYTMGATGIVNALDARTGAVVWSRNAGKDSAEDVPEWGFASSPLVIDDLVVVAASGRLVAYDAATGKLRWLGPEGGSGYSSPHLVTIDGVAQIVLLRGSRTVSVAPADGQLIWEHTWQMGSGILQPAMTVEGDVLITTGDGMGGAGMRRIAVDHRPAGWAVEERWTSRALKPYFNDFVVHKGHAYGFDGGILASIDLADGVRKWKGGRYGHGQLVLLPEQDLFLVLSEEGELALVKATPDQFTEIARHPALEGKTWNHPVVAGDTLLVRNDHEMAAFRLALASR